MAGEDERVERDSMGEMAVPRSARYGAATMRAQLNFPISQRRLQRGFLRALALVKQQAALVNASLGSLDDATATAVVQAAQEVMDGAFDGDFVVDVFQTGSGTSTNMNANEVIAHRAVELLGGPPAVVHPNDTVNMGQSSNDVIPTAIHLAAATALRDDLVPALDGLERALRTRSEEFWPVVKTGRTHLQDATPIRLGQEFLGYAGQVARARRRLAETVEELGEVALGGTAVGTGVNTHPEFAARVCARIRAITGLPVREAANHFEAQSTLDAAVAASGALRSAAIALHKIGCDIRLMGCGPRAGIGELDIPAVQPGSSIMPGKVNPVIIESLTMVVAQVIGNDAAVTFCGTAGSLLELNVMMPLAAYDLLESIDLLANAVHNFRSRCVDGLRATPHGPELVETGLMLATALAPRVGYDAAAAIAKRAHATGRTIREVAGAETALSAEELDTLLDPARMTEPGSA